MRIDAGFTFENVRTGGRNARGQPAGGSGQTSTSVNAASSSGRVNFGGSLTRDGAEAIHQDLHADVEFRISEYAFTPGCNISLAHNRFTCSVLPLSSNIFATSPRPLSFKSYQPFAASEPPNVQLVKCSTHYSMFSIGIWIPWSPSSLKFLTYLKPTRARSPSFSSRGTG